jgi:hypothetical protein
MFYNRYKNVIRHFATFLLVFFACVTFAQENGRETTPEDLFMGVRSQVVVRVLEHEMGADMFEVTMVEADYPASVLAGQVESFGQMLGNSLRGFETYSKQIDKNQFLSATFAVDGFMDSRTGEVNLQPLVRAFAGADAPHTVKGMTVILDSFRPTADTLQTFSSEAVKVQGKIGDEGTGIEYRVQLLSQNPEEIVIDPTQKPVQKPVEAPVEPDRPTWIWGLVGLGGVAAGVLVYFLVSKRTAKPTG